MKITDNGDGTISWEISDNESNAFNERYIRPISKQLQTYKKLNDLMRLYKILENSEDEQKNIYSLMIKVIKDYVECSDEGKYDA